MDRAVGIDAKDVAAVVVTRGDVLLDEIWSSLPDEMERIVWDNGARVLRRWAEGRFWSDWRGNDHGQTVENVSVYGRYAAISHALDTPVLLVQDDDCVLEPESIRALLDNYTPGWVVANMPVRFREHYPDSCLVGFGAIFDRDLPAIAFGRFAGNNGFAISETFMRAITEQPEPFLRECDTVFTTLTPRRLLDLPYRDLPHAHWPDRLWKQPEHGEQRARMLALARQVRDAR